MSQPHRYPLIRLSGMTRAFPGVLANDDVNLTLSPGEIHALLGENGAGKSTLVKMIYGIMKPDAGEVYWEGEKVDIANPAFARALGIAMVFQHFSLFDSLTVFENIALGLDRRSVNSNLHRQIADISNRYGLPLHADRHVYTLSVGERQRIEIIRCLLQQPKLLIMDEPTSVLTPQEVEKLFATLRVLAGEGMSILYISHKLGEIKALCQQATVLRGGRVVGTVSVDEQTPSGLAAMMMGKALTVREKRPQAAVGRIRLAVRDLSVDAEDEFSIPLKNIELEAGSGEILGIAGVAGNGQDELLRAINGETPIGANASVMINDQPCGSARPNRRRALGMASIPEERLGHGAVPDMNLVENTILTACGRLGLAQSGFIDSAKAESFARTVVRRFDVKTSGIDAAARNLSGGNLQKFIVGREIAQNPELLVVSQPTWGVDAGAAQAIHQALRDLADNGSALIVISQDLDEIFQLCDRICAICAGRISASYAVRQISVEQAGLLMTGTPSLESTASMH